MHLMMATADHPECNQSNRDAEAMQQAEREEDDDYDRDEAPHQRSRYVDDEAVCSGDDGGDDHDDDYGGF